MLVGPVTFLLLSRPETPAAHGARVSPWQGSSSVLAQYVSILSSLHAASAVGAR
ncbi:hypothetical protein QJS66_11925 [Kocuria rhizophila]|nr:hypothetical protein QJS66_11925 [Kocuria rhizophila]